VKNSRLLYLSILTGILSFLAIEPIWANESSNRIDHSQLEQGTNVQIPAIPPAIKDPVPLPTTLSGSAAKTPTPKIPEISDLLPLSTQAADLMAQDAPHQDQEAKITGVSIQTTATGIEIKLETTAADSLPSSAQVEGNTLVTEIDNAVLALPEGQPFRQKTPAEGITEVTVTQVAPTQVQVKVTGIDTPPVADVTTGEKGIVLAVTLGLSEEEEVEITVTAEKEQEEGYRTPNATTATKTDTPIRDIPASIQVVPRAVIRDQGATNVRETIRNVSGVTYSSSSGNRAESFSLRGFSAEQFENGFRNDFFSTRTQRDLANIEQVEVLKGPASILFGRVEPSGVVNFVTKKPLSDPFYELDFTAGSFDFYRPSADISGPLTKDKNLAYRLNLAYENAGSFRDRVQTERLFLAPSLSWQVGPDTKLSFDVTHLRDQRPIDRGIVVLSNNQIANIPISRVLGDPTQQEDFTETRATLALEHQFNSNLSLKSAFRYSNATENGPGCTLEIFGPSEDDRNFPLGECFGRQDYNTYAWQNDLTVKFKTGSIQHNLLIGTELSRLTSSFSGGFRDAGFIDIFNPDSNFTLGAVSEFTPGSDVTQTFGIYIQDQITLLNNLKVLIGGRFDTYSYESENDVFGPETNAQAFSPRLGIVYQPIPEVSLYASYSRSFTPEIGRNAGDQPFEPRRGTGYEAGIKTDFLDSRLSSTLAFYDTTLNNVQTEDLDNPGFNIQIGEQRSRGIEFDIAGEILPGWKVIATYANTNAEITEDNVLTVGNRLDNVPRNSGSLWSTYTLQTGSLKGLGVGLGIFAVGERAGDLENSFVLPGYVRLDAALFYQKDNFRIGLNFKNLSNARYFEGSQGREQVIPGAPFGISGTVSFSF
jgi:iron complex outermembrane recepter protein